MKNQEKEVEQLYEQFKVGLALAETARFTADKKVATSLAKQGMTLVAKAAAAFSEDPEDWCPTRPKNPWRGPWPRPNWLDLVVIDNPLNDPDYLSNNAQVLGTVESLRSSVISAPLKDSLKGLSKTTLELVNL